MILPGSDPQAIDEAARRLAAGELVGIPTETVYGLAADAASDAAVARIFEAKGRPSDHPLIVHVTGVQAARHFARELPDVALRLMARFWPGPLTVILPRREGVGRAATGGQDSIGLRCPSHPVARALLAACERRPTPVLGLAAPSANRFGRVSPTTAAHVQSEFGAALLVLDGGACEVGIESAIVDCTRGAPVLLRPGVLTRDQIEAACGERVRLPHEAAQPAPRASGTLESHYAPRARVRLMDGASLRTALALVGADAPAIGVWARGPLHSRQRQIAWRVMPPDPADAARELFAVLREFDEQGVDLIWIETPPDSAEWAGVNDRLRRAAA